MAVSSANVSVNAGFRLNLPPEGFNPERDLPSGFMQFLAPLHQRFTPWQRELVAARKRGLEASLRGSKPNHFKPNQGTESAWHIELPAWCADQRNQMTGPADEEDLCVKMLNSGAPGVMLDLEDSCANEWSHHKRGTENILASLRGSLTYRDQKRNREVGIQPSKTVIWIRPRGLHLSQGGIFEGEAMSASLFDVARLAYQIDAAELKHPLAIYIPKSESADEAFWWRDMFQSISVQKGWAPDYIKCMALVESHPLAYQMEEFLFNLRDHILGLNLGRWDYMASLIHFNLADADWVLPDRNTIPHNVAFFQSLRELMPEICHRRGALAIGGMTALYPSREDAELNARALAVLEQDKKNEANMRMDGAWTGHPDQNEIAVNQFPYPNQMANLREKFERNPDLRPVPTGVGAKTLNGTRAAIRTVIRYRNGVLNGKGASLLDGYMEDLATDRIYRLMTAQRMRHGKTAGVVDETGNIVVHTPELITKLFDEELEKLIANPARQDLGTPETFREARRIGEDMVLSGEFNPI